MTVSGSAQPQSGPRHYLRLSVWMAQSKFILVTNNRRHIRGIAKAEIVDQIISVYCPMIGADEFQYFGLHHRAALLPLSPSTFKKAAAKAAAV